MEKAKLMIKNVLATMQEIKTGSSIKGRRMERDKYLNGKIQVLCGRTALLLVWRILTGSVAVLELDRRVHVKTVEYNQ